MRIFSPQTRSYAGFYSVLVCVKFSAPVKFDRSWHVFPDTLLLIFCWKHTMTSFIVRCNKRKSRVKLLAASSELCIVLGKFNLSIPCIAWKPLMMISLQNQHFEFASQTTYSYEISKPFIKYWFTDSPNYEWCKPFCEPEGKLVAPLYQTPFYSDSSSVWQLSRKRRLL